MYRNQPRTRPTNKNKASQDASQSLEARLYVWLDILLYVWRRRRMGDTARFVTNAHLTEDETYVLGQAVRELSRGLTGDRSLVASRYLDDPDLLGAYLLFYWPVSYAQAWTLLHDPGLARQGFVPKGSAIDLGSGPGAMAMALLESGYDEVLALDYSPAALELAKEVLQVAAPQVGIKGSLKTVNWKAGDALNSDKIKNSSGKAFDILVAGHFLNELPNQDNRLKTLSDFDQFLAPESLRLIIEPALRQQTHELLALRDNLVSQGQRILAPCFIQGECPVLKLVDQTCHSTLHWQLPGMIKRIGYAARLGKEEPAMAWLAYVAGQSINPAPDASSDAQSIWRVVGEPMLNKAGRTRIMICGQGEGQSGRMMLSCKWGENSGTPGHQAERVFFGLGRGDVISLGFATQRENGLGLGPQSTLKKIDEHEL